MIPHDPASKVTIAELLKQQERRWRAGDGVPCEELLVRAGRTRDEAVDLVYHEFLLREELGQAPDQQEFLQRFPQYAAELRRQFEVHDAADSRAFWRSEMGLEADPVDTERVSPGTRRDILGATRPYTTSDVVGDYRIVRELGRGGMGIVYEAEQISLKRRVALKTLPYLAAIDRRRIERFQIEAQAAASLDRDGIVPVYGTGCEGGVHYYAMRLVEGPTLAQVIRQCKQCPVEPAQDNGPRSTGADVSGIELSDVLLHNSANRTRPYFDCVARIGALVADTLAYAHREGIIHRDIKPSNLLLDQEGKVWITDFGLARVERDQSLTGTGQGLGTLRYASPEQTRGDRFVDDRTDVYSLGATLYELLLLEPLFADVPPAQLLDHVLHQNPNPPRHSDPRIPRDLETIVLTAIAKRPADRYESAQRLAEDLYRFLDRRTIVARRPTLIERTGRFLQRNSKATFGVAATVLLLAILLIGGLFYHTSRLGELNDGLGELNKALQASEARTRRMLYTADMRLAYQAWLEQDLRQYDQLLDRYRPEPGGRDIRGIEWYYLARLGSSLDQIVADYSTPVYCVCYSPDGKHFATAGLDATVRIYDGQHTSLLAELETGQGEVNTVCFSPLAAQIATAGDDGTVRIWDIASSRQVLQIQAHQGQAFDVDYTPDGKLIATCGKENVVRLWDAGTGKSKGTLERHEGDIEQIDISADGRLLASASSDFDRQDLGSQDWEGAENL